MTTRNDRPPGMACPDCETFIIMPIEQILAAATFACPNADCSVELRLDGSRSSKSIDALTRYADAMKDLGQPIR